MHGSGDSRQLGADAAFETGRYVPSDGTGAISENPGVVLKSNRHHSPTGVPDGHSDDVSLLSRASVVSR